MSVKVIACLDPLSAERREFSAEPGTVADIISSLDTGWPLSQARVCLNGEIVKDFSLRANDGGTLWVKFVPHGTNEEAGGWMKAGGWLLAGAGVLVAALTGWTGIGGFFGIALVGTGIGLITSGTVFMNMNIPKPPDYEKPDADPSVRGAKNQARPYGRIPVLFGRHRVYPDLAANPFTSVIGGKQYLTLLFCGGYRDCAIDINSFKLGETSLAEFSQTKDIGQILSGADPFVRVEILQNGEASALYPHCVHEDAVNAPVQNEIKDGWGNKISGEIIRDTPDNTDSITVDIFLHNGIGKYGDSGGLEFASVEVEAHYKPFGAPDPEYEPLGCFNGDTSEISGNRLETLRFQITKDSLPRGRYTVRIRRVTPDSTSGKIIDQVHIGSIRSIKSVDESGQPARPVRPERQKDLTIIALRLAATERLNGIADSFNYIAAAKLPVYSGNGSGPLYWLNTAETRNPASALLHALRGRAAQQKVDPDDIDWPSIEAFYAWCEEHGYFCDAYLSESVTIAELLRMIGATARADILRVDSKISVVQDIERPAPVQLFTPKNTIGYSVAMFNADIPDAISVGFIDEDAGYARNESLIHSTPDGNPADDKEPESVQKLDLWGVANSAQARRIGMYTYACIKNRPFVHTIEADIEYLLCNKGDLIQYAGDIALTGAAQGRIKGTVWADGVCIGIDTDEPMAMAEGKQYAARIRKSDGTIVLKEAVYDPGKRREKSVTYYPGEDDRPREPSPGEMYAVDEEDNVYYEPRNLILFTGPMAAPDAPKAGDLYAFGVRGYEALDLVVTGIQPGQNLTAVLTCVEHSPEIFGVDNENFVLPDFENKITPVSGAVDSGAVNPDRWRSFYVYHDDDEEPPRPAGNGQGSGWHSAQTFRSVWQSVKTAESVESGEWGPPLRIRAERGLEDVTPVWLSLSPQSVALETDGNGNILAGLLPLTSQARLFKWNSQIAGGVSWSLVNAPAGISISQDGLVTVGAMAPLGNANSVTVRAGHEGSVYTAALSITVKTNSYAPRYLGTAAALPASAFQGDFVLATVPLAGRPAGSVFQWTGLAWEYRPAASHTDLYLRCYADGLDAPGLADNTEWFGAVIARLLVAQRAFIEELQAQVITLSSGGIIQSGNFDPELPAGQRQGFRIKHDGGAEFNDITVRATGKFEDGKFSGIDADGMRITGDSSFSGNIDSGVLKVLPSTQVPFSLAYPASSAQVLNFMAKVRGDLGYPSNIDQFTVFPASGTYYFYSGGNMVQENVYSIRFAFQARNEITVTSASGKTARITSSGASPLYSAFSFTVGTNARTLRLHGLPPSTTVADEVYEYQIPSVPGITFLAIKKD